jgi:hypothetical protein
MLGSYLAAKPDGRCIIDDGKELVISYFKYHPGIRPETLRKNMERLLEMANAQVKI